MDVQSLVSDLLIILLAGLVSGVICKRIGASLLVGYLLTGAVLGKGGLGLVVQRGHELEMLAEAGALLLLFAVGIEFSLAELSRLARFFLVGGSLQMLLVGAPLTLAAHLAGLTWGAAILAGTAGALSSTVLVFRALAEMGKASSPAGRRAIAILLFQDVALVPLLLLVPLLTGHGPVPSLWSYLLLAAKSLAFVGGMWLLHVLVGRVASQLADLRSVELLVLFATSILGGCCWVAVQLELPAAVGALAAGVVLSGNRLSKQVDSVLLPFRETFAAVFFVSLGLLLRPAAFLTEPLLLLGGLVAMIALKSAAATAALRCIGLRWRAAWGVGLGLAQLGEFSFLLIGEAVREGLLSPEEYNRMLFIGLGTLLLTPWMLRLGLGLAPHADEEHAETHAGTIPSGSRALVIGLGPIGRQVASRLETMGIYVTVLDLSPINLHPFAQQGFATFAGDARNAELLKRAGLGLCQLVVVCLPVDEVTVQVVQRIRALAPRLKLIVRCRLASHIRILKRAGADAIVSEEAEAAGPLIRLCETLLEAPAGDPAPRERPGVAEVGPPG